MTREASWRAPGRVNFIGEHTDYNDGYVLPFALPLGVTATVRPQDGSTVRAISRQDTGAVEIDLDRLKADEPGTVDGWAGYIAGVLWALRQRGAALGGAEITVDGDVPLGAGLSSSAALECSVAAAVGDAFDLELSPDDVVTVARTAENDYVGVPSGVLDQSASVLCRDGHVLLLDVRSGERRQLPLQLPAAGLVVLVIDTGAPHKLVDGEYAARRADCERACEALGVGSLRDIAPDALAATLARLDDEQLRRRVRHVVTENERVLRVVDLLDRPAPDLRAVGPVLTASHESLRDDYEVSSEGLDVAVRAALDAGAHGARMTGGGFGGSAIALVDAAASSDVSRAVTAAFADHDLGEPRIFEVVPSAGLHRTSEE